jgi:hypothetical protein
LRRRDVYGRYRLFELATGHLAADSLTLDQVDEFVTGARTGRQFWSGRHEGWLCHRL